MKTGRLQEQQAEHAWRDPENVKWIQSMPTKIVSDRGLPTPELHR